MSECYQTKGHEVEMISILVTGPEAALMAWQHAAMYSIELFDRRGQTVRCRVHGIDFRDLSNPNWWKPASPEELQRRLGDAVALAIKHDVTIQRIDGAGDTEMWPVLHAGSHGMMWPPTAMDEEETEPLDDED
jgi:hypothetical protein